MLLVSHSCNKIHAESCVIRRQGLFGLVVAEVSVHGHLLQEEMGKPSCVGSSKLPGDADVADLMNTL